MKRLPGYDPLEDSKMSFGEHLEELRAALWKAVVALAIGVTIGLFFGGSLIRFVQTPLEAALEDLIKQQKTERYEQLLPPGAEPDAEALNDGWVPETFYVDRDAAAAALGLEAPAHADGPAAESVEPPAGSRAPLVLWRRIEDVPGSDAMATNVYTGFGVYLKASFVVGAVLSSPFVFYFLWSFVAAGLYPHERRYVHLFLPISIALFLLGATVAFFLALRFVLGFLFQFYDWMGVALLPKIDEWLGFVLILPVGFGLSFQLPLVMLFLERIGVASVELYLRYWKYAVLGIFVLSMLLSPPDPQSQVLMALPLTALYFGGVLLCKLTPGRKPAFDAGAA